MTLRQHLIIMAALEHFADRLEFNAIIPDTEATHGLARLTGKSPYDRNLVSHQEVREILSAERQRRRVDVKAILNNASQRRRLMVGCIVATQAREGIATTREQAEVAYDKVAEEKRFSAERPSRRARRGRRTGMTAEQAIGREVSK